MKNRLKKLWFRLIRKNPEAVVVSFLTGEEPAARAMLEEIRALVPDRHHYAAGFRRPEFLPAGVEFLQLERAPAIRLFFELRRKLREKRIGIAPLLLDGTAEFTGLRRAAFLYAPLKILAYNKRLERHHLKLSTLIASILFLRGVPLERIFLRPSWLTPWKRSTPGDDGTYQVYEGRPVSLARRRVAVLTPYFPYPLSHGGAVRIFNLVREIAREFDVYLFSFIERGKPVEMQPMLELCAKMALVPVPRYREPQWSTIHPPEVGEFRSPAMQQALRDLFRDDRIELLQTEYTALATYGGDVLVEHDVTFDLYQQILARKRSWAARWDLWRWKRFETRAFGTYKRIVVMSEKDAKLVGLSAAVRILPNGVDLERFQPAPEAPGERLLFIGSFRHFPNMAGYRFFVEEVWPLLRKRHPAMRLTVVAGPDAALHWREFTGMPALVPEDGIELRGFERDVVPLYAASNVVIVPTVVSAGTNLKVLEAMAMERAVVSTPSGCAGLGLRHGHSVWVAGGAGEFAEGVSRLIQDANLRKQIARNARRFAEENFEWKRIGELQRALFHELLAAGDLPVLLRDGGQPDLAGIAAIQSVCPEASQWEPASYLAEFLVVAESGGELCGFIAVRRVAEEEYEVLNLAVAPRFRRAGVGTKLLAHACERWHGSIFLEVRESNTAARALYGKLGFVEAGIRKKYYDNPSESAVVMRFHSC